MQRNKGLIVLTADSFFSYIFTIFEGDDPISLKKITPFLEEEDYIILFEEDVTD